MPRTVRERRRSFLPEHIARVRGIPVKHTKNDGNGETP